MALEKSKPKKGGKKPKKGQEEKKDPENCAIFVALEFPEWQRKVLEVLNRFEFDEKNKIEGNYVEAIK